MSRVELKNRSVHYYLKFRLLITVACIVLSCNSIHSTSTLVIEDMNIHQAFKKAITLEQMAKHKLIEEVRLQKLKEREEMQKASAKPILTFICYGG